MIKQKVNIWLTSNAVKLEEMLDGRNSITVEAEYGDCVVKGSLATLAHHGPRSGNPCPCLYNNKMYSNLTDIGISHVDLDTVGGVLSVLNSKPLNKEFWELAAYVDLKGIHRVDNFFEYQKINNIMTFTPVLNKKLLMAQLNAWYAWAENNKLYAESHRIVDVYDWFIRAYHTLTFIEQLDENYMMNGQVYEQDLKYKSIGSLIDFTSKVCLRSADFFVNSFYSNPNSTTPFECIVGYNTRQQSITLSFIDESICDKYNITASNIMQSFWGNGAGGHRTIAGTPREFTYSLKDCDRIYEYMIKIMEGNDEQNT